MTATLLEQLPRFSEYDPGAVGEGSLDPLGLGALADRIADRLAPGVRARMSQPRFVTLSAVGAYACQQISEVVSSDGKTTFDLAFEWLVVESLVQNPNPDRLRGVPGSQKAQRAAKTKERLSSSTYLAGPRVFGFTGVYRPFSQDAKVIGLDGHPAENAERLIQAWEHDQDLSGFISGTAGSPGVRLRREIEKECLASLRAAHVTAPLNGWLMGRIADSMAPREAKDQERAALRQLIDTSRHDIRNELSSLLGRSLPAPDASQLEIARVLAAHASPTAKRALTAAIEFENCATAIEYAFRRMLAYATSLGGTFSIEQATSTPQLGALAPRLGTLTKRAIDSVAALDESLAHEVVDCFYNFDHALTRERVHRGSHRPAPTGPGDEGQAHVARPPQGQVGSAAAVPQPESGPGRRGLDTPHEIAHSRRLPEGHHMKPRPLLDLWQKPDGAGDPLGVFATTFTLDPDFFERNCLARFLAVESVDEGTGSADDLVAQLELEEGLIAPMVAVLADRSAQAERSTLRWDLLHCQVGGGLLHSKVAILLWEHATRVIVGSANLTPAGYRRNIELAMVADLGPACLLPREVLEAVADELESYLSLVPGLDATVPANQQAVGILRLFRSRAASQRPVRSALSVALAPTNPTTQPLDRLADVWKGAQPLGATHVSPFWDATDSTVLKTVGAMLTGRPAADRWHGVAVTIGPGGETSFPPRNLKTGLVNEVVQLGPLDENIRPLHAKCLVVHSNQWVAAMVGSSNHTTAGLGLGGHRRHRELNVWMGASLDSREGQALRDLVPLGPTLDLDAPFEEPDDEDEPDDLVVLPAFFQLCRLAKHGDAWELRLTFEPSASPKSWLVSLPSHDLVIDNATWTHVGSPASFVRQVDATRLPMFLEVEWDGAKATWVVIADDRHDLPARSGARGSSVKPIARCSRHRQAVGTGAAREAGARSAGRRDCAAWDRHRSAQAVRLAKHTASTGSRAS